MTHDFQSAPPTKISLALRITTNIHWWTRLSTFLGSDFFLLGLESVESDWHFKNGFAWGLTGVRRCLGLLRVEVEDKRGKPLLLELKLETTGLDGLFHTILINFLFWNHLRLKRSCKNSTDCSWVFFILLSPERTSYITTGREQNKDMDTSPMPSTKWQALRFHHILYT